MKVTIIQKDTVSYQDDLDDKQIEAFVKACVQDLKKTLKRIIPDVGIIFVSKDKIKHMNSQYRHIDEYTDVLSFNAEEDGYLGDIVIAKEIVAKYAKEFNCTYAQELKRDILHGIMHLLGFDHEGSLRDDNNEKMFVVQEDILQKHISS